MMRFSLYLLTFSLASGVCSAFQPNAAFSKLPLTSKQFLPQNNNDRISSPTTTTTTLWSTPSGDGDNEKKKSSAGFDEKLRTKLVSETIAPWRSVRLFAYGSLGSGALIGGLITLSGTAAALSGVRPDLELNTQFLNLAIDFGGVVAFAFLAKYDLGKSKELNERVEDRIEKKKEQKQVVKGMRERELQLGTLKLAIQTGPDGSTREVAVGEVQSGASQHMIVVAGPKKACKDALVGANLLKMDLDFAMKNVLVVPYETGVDENELQSRPSGGFGDRPMYETQPYVARPAGQGWDAYIKAEMNDAVKQNGEKAKNEGIALVVCNTGKVIRRGVGKVPWRQMLEQLQEEGKIAKEGGSQKNFPLFLE